MRLFGLQCRSPFLALRVISRLCSDLIAFGEKRTSNGRQDRPVRSKMTHSGHSGQISSDLPFPREREDRILAA
jgi:hypothetical protein